MCNVDLVHKQIYEGLRGTLVNSIMRTKEHSKQVSYEVVEKFKARLGYKAQRFTTAGFNFFFFYGNANIGHGNRLNARASSCKSGEKKPRMVESHKKAFLQFAPSYAQMRSKLNWVIILKAVVENSRLLSMTPPL